MVLRELAVSLRGHFLSRLKGQDNPEGLTDIWENVDVTPTFNKGMKEDQAN